MVRIAPAVLPFSVVLSFLPRSMTKVTKDCMKNKED